MIRKTNGNSTFAIDGVLCYVDGFVVIESSVLRMNTSAVNSAHRKLQNLIQMQNSYQSSLFARTNFPKPF
jgi:hypothetical protein